MTIEFRSAAGRFRTQKDGRTTWHGFSFGAYYDPDNIDFGPIIALNDEWLPAGTGYEDHLHEDIEIVSLVLAGELEHSSDLGARRVFAVAAQRLSAGSGVHHRETNPRAEPTRFLQTWLRSSRPERLPRYAAYTPVITSEWSQITGPDHPHLPIDTAARLEVARLDEGDRVELPDSRQMLMFVCSGAVSLGERLVEACGQARLYDEPRRPITATSADTLVAVWALS